MRQRISTEIVIAYSQCPQKAFLLMYHPEKQGTCHEYIKIFHEKQIASQQEFVRTFIETHANVQLDNISNLKNRSQFLVNPTLTVDDIEAECTILTQKDGHCYEPTIVIGTHKISKTDKIRLFWVSYVLEKIGSKISSFGQIINVGGKSFAVKIDNKHKIILPFIKTLKDWKNTESIKPPPLILTRYCHICQFYSFCRNNAEQEDNLSLLDRVTPKMIRQYEKKGIFTVKQLSYLYKPRKRKKRSKNPSSILHRFELQALAIREKKIYLQELPELSRQPTEIFLDIEGNPDKQSYYLIGILVCQTNDSTYHAFWAEHEYDEEQIWRQFLEVISQYPNTPIYHYGSYELKVLEKLSKRYGTDIRKVNEQMINVHHLLYGKVYFPVYSNRLKEIGHFIGARWTTPKVSGLQTIIWRHYWEVTLNTQYKDSLLIYNAEDCHALRLLTDELFKISQYANSLSQVEFADKRNHHSTEVREQLHMRFRSILEFSYFGYDQKKICFRQEKKKDDETTKSERNRSKIKKLHKKLLKVKGKIQKVIQVPQRIICPQCAYNPLRIEQKKTKRLIINLVTTRNGIKKTVTEFVGRYEYCPQCKYPYPPPFKDKQNQLYGHGLKAWIAYQRIALRLPYESISESLKEQFKEDISAGSISNLLKGLAIYYSETEDSITHHLIESPFIHADETTISIQGMNWYVWVFTNGQHVLLKLQETREATIVHNLLANYKGILISDFYSGYDSVRCAQQKCWVHLIGDLNNDLREAPFDTELEKLVFEIKDLILPIMECIQKYGLKRRHFTKFKQHVEKFYNKIIFDTQYKSDLAAKYQKRFKRYQESLFTFLDHDGIPWHNNPAERAIRPIAKQRAISSSFAASVLDDYLVLLGIRQTCRAQRKSFFKFLFSEEKDLDKFEASKRKIYSS